MKKYSFLFSLKLIPVLLLMCIVAVGQDGTTKSGCGGNKPKPAADSSALESRRWSLTEINGTKTESTKAFVEFNIAEKRIAGNAGCNRMFGKFEINGEAIKFSGIGSTKVFCAQEGVMKLESDFLKALENTTRFAQQGDTLNFYAADNLILKFSGTPKSSSDTDNSTAVRLEDKKWILATIAGKAVPKLENAPFLVFDKQKAGAGGNSGCNSFGGSYKSEGDKISITEIISTQIACEDERGNIEREFFDNLRKVNRFEIKAGKLNLYASETLLLTFDAGEKS